MKLKLTQSNLHFKDENNNLYSLRIIQPSKGHGAWRGNKMILREWRACYNENINSYYTPLLPGQLVKIEEYVTKYFPEYSKKSDDMDFDAYMKSKQNNYQD